MSEAQWPERPEDRPWTEAEWERFIRAHEAEAKANAAARTQDGPLLAELGLDPGAGEAPTVVVEERFGDEPDAQIGSIRAFRLAREFATAIRRARLTAAGAANRLRSEPFWSDLAAEAQRIAQHIASGHGLGYEDHHICGNIVKCREALSHVDRSIALLERLQQAPESNGLTTPLLGTAQFIRRALEDRIRALRTRVWWDDQRARG